MKENPLVSVIISLYNETVDMVSQAINSIRTQTYENLEILLLLDCVENSTVKEYMLKVEKEDRRVKCLFHEKNMGLVRSLNKGVEHSQGEFICRMDADDIARPDRIEKQLAFIATHGLDIVGSYVELIDMKGKKIGKGRHYPSSNKYICQYMKYSNPIPHPTWLIRSRVYSKLEGYRNISHVEDYDFLVRAKIFGFEMGNIPEKLLYYRINNQGITQKNIAKQKILSAYVAKQLKYNQIYDEVNIIQYLGENVKKQRQLESYYRIGKSIKERKKVKIFDMLTFICNYNNVIETWQRLMCKWIMYKDEKNDYY